MPPLVLPEMLSKTGVTFSSDHLETVLALTSSSPVGLPTVTPSAGTKSAAVRSISAVV